MPGRVVVVGLGPAGPTTSSRWRAPRSSGAPLRFARTAAPSRGRRPRRRRASRSRRSTRVYDAAPDLEPAYARDRRRAASTPPASTARWCTRCRAARRSPSARSRCCASRSRDGRGRRWSPGVSFADLAWVRLGVDPMDGDARVVDGRAIDDAELAGPLLIAQCDSTFVLSDVKLALLEHLDPATPVTVLQRLGLADEQVVDGRRSRSSTAARSCPTTSRRCSSTPVPRARRARWCGCSSWPSGCAIPAGARGTPSRPTTRSPGTCSRSRTRWSRRSRRCPPTAARSTPPAYAALEDELGDLLYQVVFHAVLARGGRRVHHGRRRPRHPRQARAPAPARVRRRRGRRDRATSCATGSRSRRRRRARRRSSRASRPGCRRCSTRTSCSARRRRSASTPATSARRSTASTSRVARLRAGGDDLEADLAQVLAAAVVVARAGGVDAESALRGWAARYRAPLRGHGAARRSTATSTSPPSTPPASPPSGSNPRTSGSSPSHAHGTAGCSAVSRGRRRGWCPCGRR